MSERKRGIVVTVLRVEKPGWGIILSDENDTWWNRLQFSVDKMRRAGLAPMKPGETRKVRIEVHDV